VVLKYVENLIAWGDSLFRQETMESVNEALQIYVLANHVLGDRPEVVPKRGTLRAESYDSLAQRWDDFSNAQVELQNIFPYSSDASISEVSTGPNLLGTGKAFYFCIPPNDKLLEYWNTAADRLDKIRHCKNIDGVDWQPALFAPPIDPAALIQAMSQGLSLGSILADLSTPPPLYRFTTVIQKANEFCADVKALGSELLAALEKKDAEELGRLRASHETQMLEAVTAIRERQVLEAEANKENLVKARSLAEFRFKHYMALLGNDTPNVPASPSLNATLTADSQLPPDTVIPKVQTNVDQALQGSGETGLKVLRKEKEALDKSDMAKLANATASAADAAASILNLFPGISTDGKPYGVGAGSMWGGQNLGAASTAVARASSGLAAWFSQQAAQASTTASYIRREQEWTLQANIAAQDIIQIDKQITSADIRIQIAEKELENHLQQIENTKQVEDFLKNKFTNQELYQWMKEQLFSVYKQSYNLAYDMAKKAEKAYRFETGVNSASFIQYGYWDNSQQGLIAGEKLQLALRDLERAYLNDNRREFELNKSVSLRSLDPVAFITLRETGQCYVSIPEELFDLDFQGHYFRRLKAVRVSIPCVAGPYTSVNCTARLISNALRINTNVNGDGYEHANDQGIWTEDERFRSNLVPVTAIATSHAQNDAGMFEFNFRDERYLPFEGAGVISRWQIELSKEDESTETDLRLFDYSTISDVILHLDYTARDGGEDFQSSVTTHLLSYFDDPESPGAPFMRVFSMREEFPTEWYRFFHPATAGADQVLSVTLGRQRFPLIGGNRDVTVSSMDVFARCFRSDHYIMTVSYALDRPDPVVSGDIELEPKDPYGGLHHVHIDSSALYDPTHFHFGLNLEDDLDITQPISLQIKRKGEATYAALAAEPENEIQDVHLVLHYKLRKPASTTS